MTQANNQAVLFALGVNHKTASVQVREKLFIHEHETAALLRELRQTLSECLVLSTCNRTEIYGVHPTADIDFDYYKDLIINFKNASEFVTRDDFFTSVSCAACQQLFMVATSIDSKIVGDTQILQQLRHAYFVADENSATGKILNQLLQRSFKLGKKVYHQTSIHRGAVSMSLAAVEFAAKTFDSLSDKTILIVGAGETAQLTAECLLKRRIGKILVTNRTRANSEKFLEELHKTADFTGEVLGFRDFKKHLNEVDIVISSTSSPEPILTEEDFQNQTHKILLIDIAVPRDIAPEVARNKFVVLKNIDDLNSAVTDNHARRLTEVPQVKKMIFQEMGDFLVWYYSLPLMPAIKQIEGKADYQTVEKIKKIKTFLEENASNFHKMAKLDDANNELNEHLSLIDCLFELQKTVFEESRREE